MNDTQCYGNLIFDIYYSVFCQAITIFSVLSLVLRHYVDIYLGFSVLIFKVLFLN